jgi:hypothetical protein
MAPKNTKAAGDAKRLPLTGAKAKAAAAQPAAMPAAVLIRKA